MAPATMLRCRITGSCDIAITAFYLNYDYASAAIHHNLIVDCDHGIRYQSTQQNARLAIYANSFHQPTGGKHIFFNSPERQPGDAVVGVYQNSHAGKGFACDVGSDGQHVSLPFVYVANMVMSVDDVSSFGDVSWGAMSDIHRSTL